MRLDRDWSIGEGGLFNGRNDDAVGESRHPETGAFRRVLVAGWLSVRRHPGWMSVVAVRPSGRTHSIGMKAADMQSPGLGE
jgi:hypothetical protein